MIVDEIIQGVVDAVANATPATDSDAPSTFAHVSAFEAHGRGTSTDRSFTVELSRSDPDAWHHGTSTAGMGQYAVRLEVVVRYVNEGRARYDMEKVIAQDRRIIIDNVPVYIRDEVTFGAGAGAGECVYEGGALEDVSPRVIHSRFTFRVEYVDTIVAVP
jgi:hypothetical protein